MNTRTYFTPMQMIEYSIEEAKPVFWIQDVRIEGVEAVIEVEMSYLGIKQDFEFRKPVQDVFEYNTYMEEEYSDMEHEAYRWLDKQAESFMKIVSEKLAETFKKQIALWNK